MSRHTLCICKVKFPLYLINYALCHEDVWESGGTTPPFLSLALDGREWSASRPCRFTPGGSVPSAHCIGGWVGPRAGLDTVEWREISCPCWESNPDRPFCSPSLYHLSYPGSYRLLLTPRKLLKGFEFNLVLFYTKKLFRIIFTDMFKIPNHTKFCLRRL
jgi:hypothetical protein